MKFLLKIFILASFTMVGNFTQDSSPSDIDKPEVKNIFRGFKNYFKHNINFHIIHKRTIGISGGFQSNNNKKFNLNEAFNDFYNSKDDIKIYTNINNEKDNYIKIDDIKKQQTHNDNKKNNFDYYYKNLQGHGKIPLYITNQGPWFLKKDDVKDINDMTFNWAEIKTEAEKKQLFFSIYWGKEYIILLNKVNNIIGQISLQYEYNHGNLHSLAINKLFFMEFLWRKIYVNLGIQWNTFLISFNDKIQLGKFFMDDHRELFSFGIILGFRFKEGRILYNYGSFFSYEELKYYGGKMFSINGGKCRSGQKYNDNLYYHRLHGQINV